MNINSNYVLLFTVVTLLTYLSLKAVYGDDSNDVRGCILPEFCNNMAKQTIEDRTQILQMWNAAGCSIRDICTPINETGKMPP